MENGNLLSGGMVMCEDVDTVGSKDLEHVGASPMIYSVEELVVPVGSIVFRCTRNESPVMDYGYRFKRERTFRQSLENKYIMNKPENTKEHSFSNLRQEQVRIFIF